MSDKIKKIELKNGDVRWTFQVYTGVNPKTGKQGTTERRFNTYKEARIALRRIQTQVDDGTYYDTKINVPKPITFKEVYDKWNNEYKFTVAESTHLKTTSNFTNRILPEIGHFKLNNITHDDIQMLANKWKDYTNCKVWIRDISRIFKYGIRHNYAKHNPADHVVFPKKKAKNKEVKLFYEKSELKLIVKQLEELDDPLIESYMRLLIFGGLRNGEVLGLRWSRIDFDNNLIRIDQAVGRRRKGKSTELYIKDPKNEPSHRTISIDEKTIEVLTDLKEITGSSGLVFKSKNKGILSDSKARKWLMSLAKDAGVEFVNVHGLRHTHASLLFESGASIKYVMHRLGHKDIETTMNIYTMLLKSPSKIFQQNSLIIYLIFSQHLGKCLGKQNKKACNH